jgi:hypothetical protein
MGWSLLRPGNPAPAEIWRMARGTMSSAWVDRLLWAIWWRWPARRKGTAQFLQTLIVEALWWLSHKKSL